MDTTTKKIVNAALYKLDKAASDLLQNPTAFGLTPTSAFSLAQVIDKVADDIETEAYGAENLQRRAMQEVERRDAAGQPPPAATATPAPAPAAPVPATPPPAAPPPAAATVTAGQRKAEVLQRDADEGYMNTFKNPMAPIQIESDEPYMKAYGDDQSSAVIHGESTTGRDLAPGH